MPVFIQVPENPNCAALDGQVFQCRTPPRPVTQVRIEHDGRHDWCDITGIDETGDPCPATACLIEDSGEGTCYLVIGGAWGVRLKRASVVAAWSLADDEQWGECFSCWVAMAPICDSKTSVKSGIMAGNAAVRVHVRRRGALSNTRGLPVET